MNIIEVENLVRDFSIGRFLSRKRELKRAVDHLSFQVRKGEVFGLLGPNGAGKTTTLKILSTMLAPTSGQVKVLGHSTVKDERLIRQRINFIFGGERSIYWKLTALENLEYFANLYHVDPETQRKRIPELLATVGLEPKDARRPVETFSKGMKQKVQIAKGLVNDPDIIFFDEPTIGLDPVSALKFRQIVKDLARQGKTILLTTHYLAEAEDLCNRICVINHGRLVKLASTQELLDSLPQESSMQVEIRVVAFDHEMKTSIQRLAGTRLLSTSSLPQETVLLFEIRAGLDSSLGSLCAILGPGNIKHLQTKKPDLEEVYLRLLRQGAPS